MDVQIKSVRAVYFFNAKVIYRLMRALRFHFRAPFVLFWIGVAGKETGRFAEMRQLAPRCDVTGERHAYNELSLALKHLSTLLA